MILASPAATERLAQIMRPRLKPGDTLLLDGPVGAGKSAFARALIQDAMAAAGQPVEPVPSPTFTLVQTYDIGAQTFWHADLYRLGSPDELAELGLDIAFDTAITLVEWPERLGSLTPARHLRITLHYSPRPDERILSLLPSGEGWDWVDLMIRSFSGHNS